MEPVHERLLREAGLLPAWPRAAAGRQARAAAMRAEVWRARLDQLRRFEAEHGGDGVRAAMDAPGDGGPHAGLVRWLRRPRARAPGDGDDEGAPRLIGSIARDNAARGAARV